MSARHGHSTLKAESRRGGTGSSGSWHVNCSKALETLQPTKGERFRVAGESKIFMSTRDTVVRACMAGGILVCEVGSQRSDIFSLGVIAYQMLSGRLPYGAEVARTRTRAQQKKLSYKSVLRDNREIPAWVDGALKKAVHPYQRYDELSEFVFDLRYPNKKFVDTSAKPLIERDPLLFWKCLSAILFVALLIALALLAQHLKH